ncbi:MAG: threonine synthase [Candidatus Cryptobacteroides sp.]
MKYFSTRDTSRQHPHSLKDAARLGLAPDGGLFMPESVPQVDLDKVRELARKSYPDLASYLASLFFGEDLPVGQIDAMVRKAYGFDCPLNTIAPGVNVLELFHGPTCAFKDFGARFMGGMFGLLNTDGEDLTILTATSGDTGSAVAAGFLNVPGTRVVVLYPEGKVSPLQEAQMTTLGGNITPVRVRGSFDDCQALVKAVFNDSRFRQTHNVTSANSINLLRWIPQSFYYFYAWAQWATENAGDPEIVVPSGNYGNVTAGMLAWKMGMPVRRFTVASNANDVIPKFLVTGTYEPGPSVATVANAMDVGAPSNYERMMYLFGNDFSSLKDMVGGYSFSDAQIKSAIVDIYRDYGYLSDPHSAVAYLAFRNVAADGFYLATAHAAKFSEVISEAFAEYAPQTGWKLDTPSSLAAAMGKEKVFTSMDNSLEELEKLIDGLWTTKN